MAQVTIDQEKIRQTLQEFQDFGSEEVLTIALASLAFLHKKKVATISLNKKGIHGCFHASEDFNAGEFFWPFLCDSETVLSDKIDIVEGNDFSIPNLSILNIPSATSSNSSVSRKTSPTLLPTLSRSTGFYQPLFELPLINDTSNVNINQLQVSPTRSLPLSNISEIDTSSMRSGVQSSPILPQAPYNVLTEPISFVGDYASTVDEHSKEIIKSDKEISPAILPENQVHSSIKKKTKEFIEDFKQKLLNPATLTSDTVISHIFQNFKAGRPTIMKRSQGCDSIANSIFLIERLAESITTRSLSIFQFINIGRVFYELSEEASDTNNHVKSRLCQSILTSLGLVAPSFNAKNFEFSKPQVLKYCSRGKFYFKLFQTIGNSLLSTVLQNQIQLLKLSDNTNEDNAKLIEWVIANKEAIIQSPGKISDAELERLERISNDPMPISPTPSIKGKSPTSETSPGFNKLANPKKRRSVHKEDGPGLTKTNHPEKKRRV